MNSGCGSCAPDPAWDPCRCAATGRRWRVWPPPEWAAAGSSPAPIRPNRRFRRKPGACEADASKTCPTASVRTAGTVPAWVARDAEASLVSDCAPEVARRK